VENKNNISVNIRFLAKEISFINLKFLSSDIRNFQQIIRSNVKRSEVATILGLFTWSC